MNNIWKIIVVLICSVPVKSYSQDPYKRSVGLTTSLQSGDIGIQVPIWINQKITVAPYVSVVSVSEAGSDFGFGIIPKFYLSMGKLAPYFGMKFGVALFTPDGSVSENTTDIAGGMAFGGDYFFDPRFSIGVEGQINVSASDKNSSRFGNPGGTNINTGMAINVSVFFGK